MTLPSLQADPNHQPVPSQLWSSDDGPAPVARDVLTQIAHFLDQYGLTDTFSSLLKEAGGMGLDVNIDEWERGLGDMSVPLMELYSEWYKIKGAYPALPSNDSVATSGAEDGEDSDDEDGSDAQLGAARVEEASVDSSDVGGKEKVKALAKRKRVLTPDSTDDDSSDSDSGSDSSESSSDDDEPPPTKRAKVKNEDGDDKSDASSNDAGSSDGSSDTSETHSSDAASESSTDANVHGDGVASAASSHEDSSSDSGSESESSDSSSSSDDDDSDAGPDLKPQIKREDNAQSDSTRSTPSPVQSKKVPKSSRAPHVPPTIPSKAEKPTPSTKKSKKLKVSSAAAVAAAAIAAKIDTEDEHVTSAASSATLTARSPPPSKKSKVKKQKVKTEDQPAEETKITAEPVSISTNDDDANGGMHPDRLSRMPTTKPSAAKPNKDNTPFSRVAADTKVDPKFASNEYVPYDYAQRAYQDLSVTKGKGFTKEKNKKKRGAYRGGAIDLVPKGIKFDD